MQQFLQTQINRNEGIRVFLINTKKLKHLNSVEVSIMLYPYSKILNSNSFKILPFEEYIDDLNKSKRSSYKIIDDFTDKLFGMILGILIFLIFLIIDPNQLLSIESVISIFGAYTVGKEIWIDLEEFLINRTLNSALTFKKKKYFYSKVHFGTIENFWELARRIKHSGKTLLPTKVDFIEQSNSKNIQMFFSMKDLKSVNSESALIANFSFEEVFYKHLNKDSYMMTFEFIKNRKFMGISFSKEYFWAKSRGENGIIHQNKFIPNKILLKRLIRIRRFEIYLGSKIITEDKL
jgi:hypothetical protein